HQRERGGGGLLLAVGVVLQQLGQVRESILDPGGGGRRAQDGSARVDAAARAHVSRPRVSQLLRVSVSATRACCASAKRSAGDLAIRRSSTGCTAANCAGSCGTGSLRCL